MDQINIFEFVEHKYTPPLYFDKAIRVFESFAGIGCQAMAFEKEQFDYRVVGISEIDKFALASYKAIHGKAKNYGDITKMVDIPECDIFTWSFPCQDLSIAGKRGGITEETRSGLAYDVIRVLNNTKVKPTVLIMENVPNLVHEFRYAFTDIKKEIKKMGYKNFVALLNAKDFTIPQNRNRVFMVSILGDYHYEFPVAVKLEKRLKDFLEENVDEKYYLSQKHSLCARDYKDPKLILETDTTLCLNPKVNGKQPSLQDRVYSTEGVSTEGVSTAITTSFNPYVAIPDTLGYVEKKVLGTYNYGASDTFMKNRDRFNEDTDKVGTIETKMKHGIVLVESSKPKTVKLRKLTPRECWRLMGISDENFDKASKVVSNSQLYKQAGNGIVVDVFSAILKNLIRKEK